MEKPNLSTVLGSKNSFDLDLNDYREDFQSLLIGRGVNPLAGWLNQPITEESIAACLNFFYRDLAVGLLVYFYEKGELKIWLLTRDGIQYSDHFAFETLTLSKLERELKQGLAQQLSSSEQGETKRMGRFAAESERETIDVPKVIKELSNYLLPAMLVTRLKELDLAHLVIVPTLNIQQIPLAILEPPELKGQFIDHWSYCLAFNLYEVADLMLKAGTQTIRKKTAVSHDDFVNGGALFLGNPSFGSTTTWRLSPLPGAETEVREICQELKIPQQQILLGKAATKAAVLEKSKKARLLYFATHGVSSEADPLDKSGLFLTPSDDSKSGLWTAREIQHTKLAAEMVILSACQTGLGDAQDAGVIGLSRAFHLAGASKVVISLWAVDDMATKDLMKIFMEKLQEPHHFFPAGHLRQAMLAFRKKHPSPSHWAAFSVMGIA